MGQGSRATVEALVPGQGSRTTVEAQAVAVVVVLGGVKAGTKVAKAGLCCPKTLKP